MQMELERQQELEKFQDMLYKEKNNLDENLLPTRPRPDRLLKLTPNSEFNRQAQKPRKVEKTEA